jgi:hypothetical protein
MYMKRIFFLLLLGLALTSAAVASDPNLAGAADPNLVGWWKFDETGGSTAADSSGKNNNGTLYGAVFVAGYKGNALKFYPPDGNDYANLSIGSVIKTLDEATFAIWVNWAGGAVWQRIFDIGSGQSNYIYICPKTGETSAAMRVALVSDGTGVWDEFDASTGSLAPGWHHVAVTVSKRSKTMIMYLDGEVVGSKTNCANAVSDLGQTNLNWLGKSQYPDPYFNGTLDDFRIYNRVLSQADIKKLASSK